MQKNQDGCYCPEKGDFGHNTDMMTVCFNCGIVICDTFIDLGDETRRYEDGPENNSRCNGYTKTSYMSNQNNLSISFKNMKISSYSQNFIKWSSFTNDDLIILKMKDFLERKSYKYNLKSSHIACILNKYKELLNLKKINKTANFKGKYTKGILAVFTYIAMKPIKKEIVCEIFDINDNFALFNKCCKIYKDLFGQDVNELTMDKHQILSNLLEEYDIPYKIKDLIEKGYSICLQFNIFDNIYNKKTTLAIFLFFLEELNYDTDDIKENNLVFVKSKTFKQMIEKMSIIKYEIFNEIKKMK